MIFIFKCPHTGASCQETISGMYGRLDESLIIISSKNVSKYISRKQWFFTSRHFQIIQNCWFSFSAFVM